MTCMETTCAPLAVGVSEPVVAIAVVAVPGVPGVNAVVVPATVVPNPRNGVLVSTILVPDSVGVAFRLAPHAAVNNTRKSEPNKNSLEIFFMACLAFLLWNEDNMICMTVIDKGKGFDPPPLNGPMATEREEHIGLRGMRDRVALLGGKFSLTSSPGEGTRVLVKVPVNV